MLSITRLSDGTTNKTRTQKVSQTGTLSKLGIIRMDVDFDMTKNQKKIFHAV
jgi:hypothetical protein